MKSKKTISLVAIGFAIVVFGAKDAAAQAPVVSATASGPVATVQWTTVAGATGYDIEVTGSFSGSVNVPASVTFFQVTPPAGTYNIRVRGTAGSVVGPFSDVASVTVGGSGPASGPCAPPPAPTANVTTSGTSATVSWNSVAGALGYRIEFSRTPGGTELVYTVGPGQTSLAGVSPFLGTFYVRVVTGNTCGTATSPEVAFTIGSPAPGPSPGPGTSAGSGPRTPDPPPGQLLSLPGYGAAVVDDVARRFPGELAAACGTRTWLYRVLHELRRRDSRWGLNYKRGHAGALSTDIITYNGTNRPDNGEPQVYLVDIISAICEGNFPTWNSAPTDVTWNAGLAGDPACGTRYCAMWTIDPYLAAGFPAFPQ
jgi:hypothetical protein